MRSLTLMSERHQRLDLGMGGRRKISSFGEWKSKVSERKGNEGTGTHSVKTREEYKCASPYMKIDQDQNRSVFSSSAP